MRPWCREAFDKHRLTRRAQVQNRGTPFLLEFMVSIQVIDDGCRSKGRKPERCVTVRTNDAPCTRTSKPPVIFAQAQLPACNHMLQRACLREDPNGETITAFTQQNVHIRRALFQPAALQVSLSTRSKRLCLLQRVCACSRVTKNCFIRSHCLYPPPRSHCRCASTALISP